MAVHPGTVATDELVRARDCAALIIIASAGALLQVGGHPATDALLVIALLAAAASPAAAVAAVTLALPFTYRPIPIHGGLFSPLEVSIGLLTVSSFGRLARHGTHRPLRSVGSIRDGAGAPALLFLLAATISLMTVADPTHRHDSLREYRVVIIEPLLFYLGARATLRQHRARRFIAGAMIVGAVTIALGAVAQVALGYGVAADGVRRATVTFPHPNNLSFYLERVGTFAAGAGMVLPWSRWRALIHGTALVILLGVAATLSRGAIASVVLGLGTLSLLSGRGRRAVWTAILGSLVVSLLFAALASGRLVDVGGNGRWPTRFLIWRSSLAMAFDHPFWGVGLDQFLYLYWRRYVEPGGWPERYTSHPHNLLLDLWLRVGILGTVAFGWLISRVIRLSRLRFTQRDRVAMPYVAGATAALIAGFSHGMVDNGFFLPDVAVMTWLFIAMLDASPGDTVRA